MPARRRVAYVALTALAIGCASGTGPARDINAFERKLGALQTIARIPGISAGIAQGTEVVWEKGFGLADLAAGRPATDTTVFHLASLTKPFASVMLMQLVNEGKIALDDPVSQYGINLTSTGTIRVRHLLSHTSSGTPGSVYQYDGDRFSLLDSVFKRADGRTFASALYARIITPLGMKWIAPNPGSVFLRAVGHRPRHLSGQLCARLRFRHERPNPVSEPLLDRRRTHRLGARSAGVLNRA
jgi:CubicO group peptidase (beta-lactamase class C family)